MKVSFSTLSAKSAVYSNTNCIKKNKSPSFGINLKNLINTIPRSAWEIERDLFQKHNIRANFQGNDLIANCIDKTTRIFAEIFNRDYLPQKVEFKSFDCFEKKYKDAVGLFTPVEKTVYVNSDYAMHHNKALLYLAQSTEKWPIPVIGNNSSTCKSLHTFVHEFAHCAHFSNVLEKGNSY